MHDGTSLFYINALILLRPVHPATSPHSTSLPVWNNLTAYMLELENKHFVYLDMTSLMNKVLKSVCIDTCNMPFISPCELVDLFSKSVSVSSLDLSSHFPSYIVSSLHLAMCRMLLAFFMLGIAGSGKHTFYLSQCWLTSCLFVCF